MRHGVVPHAGCAPASDQRRPADALQALFDDCEPPASQSVAGRRDVSSGKSRLNPTPPFHPLAARPKTRPRLVYATETCFWLARSKDNVTAVEAAEQRRVDGLRDRGGQASQA
jgi:hypothetical protein